MKISISNQVTNENPSRRNSFQESIEMKKLFKEIMKEKGEIDEAKFNWVNGETVELKGVSPISVHSFLEQAEALGKRVKYTSTTTIDIG
ncbi:hypothetical protein [Reichenbachiella versicolor]|uniref:hypothetical protein n=1 Tax=Reichenbachiella versicolor TaxID=1821036 RepID=UPI000D6E60CE|nr:hypothetical protein [Reichenbachiella versicolor]